MAYDPTNIFARIIRGEIPCKKVYEDDQVLAFHDINPQAPVHVLVIPKGPFTNFEELAAEGNDAELAALLRAVPLVAAAAGVGTTGYRVLVNNGTDANQEVPHLHLHIFGGKRLGRMLPRAEG